jgi:hypothetical protein
MFNTSSFVREFEPVRLLGLQLLGKLLAGIPSEKKGVKLFPLPLGQSRSNSENLTDEITSAPQLFFYLISERLFKFPLSDNLCSTLFSVLGGTTPQQVIAPTSCHIVIYLRCSCTDLVSISCRCDMLFSLYWFSRKILSLIHQGIKITIFQTRCPFPFLRF